jgi:hypothetical protein
MEMMKKTTPAEIGETKRVYLSLASQLFVVFISLLTFFFYAFPFLKISYTTRNGIQTEFFSVYTGLSRFSWYVSAFIYLSAALSFIIIVFYLMQIFSVYEMHIPNIVLLGLKVLCGEFLLKFLSAGGYVLFALYIFDFIQYFVFLGKHKEADYWTLGCVALMDISLLPSAIATGALYQG